MNYNLNSLIQIFSPNLIPSQNIQNNLLGSVNFSAVRNAQPVFLDGQADEDDEDEDLEDDDFEDDEDYEDEDLDEDDEFYDDEDEDYDDDQDEEDEMDDEDKK